MSGPTASPPIVAPVEPPRRSWLPCGCVLALFLMVVLVPVLGWMAWSVTAAREVESAWAAIRARGEPTTIDELNSWYHAAPEGGDVTKLLMEILEPLDTQTYGDAAQGLPIVSTEAEVPPAGQEWAQLEAVEEFLALYSDSMEGLHELGRIGGETRFSHEFEKGFQLQLPHVQQARSGARMLALEVHVRAHRSDAAGAAESIRSMVALGRSLENEPIIVSQLVSIAIQGMAFNMLNDTVAYVDYSDEDLASLQAVFREERRLAGMRRAVVGERVLASSAFRDPAVMRGVQDGPSLPMRANNEDLALYLRYMSEIVDATHQPLPQAIDAADQAEQRMMNIANVSTLSRTRYPMTMMVAPANQAAFVAMGGGVAQSRIAEAGLAVERYRLAHGELPKTLDDLVPEFLSAAPVDPLDGQPLRYVVRQKEYLIYSVGRNRVDDGGTDEDARDTVFRVLLSE